MRFLASLGMTTVFVDIMVHLERRRSRRSKCTSKLVRVIFYPKRSQESFFDKPFFLPIQQKRDTITCVSINFCKKFIKLVALQLLLLLQLVLQLFQLQLLQ